jgi:hypothetical protein
MRAMLVLAAATACAIPDQKSNPLVCAADPLPTTAPAQVTIGGTIVDPYQNIPVPGATVQLMPTGFSTMTGDTGEFSGMLATGGTPSSSYLKLTNATYVDTYYYPGAPIAGDLDVPIEMLLPPELAAIGSASGVALGSNSAELIISVVDCGGSAVAGATVTTDSGTVVYFANDKPDPAATSTDALTGAALVVNITGSSTAVTANADQIMFRNHSVGTVPGALTETTIQP